ncbi:MAG: hypothetical protein K2F78_04905, partial [Muribaculaceae bacterium]|nr:hypothetical protein [Muribaculaceae bacterium]
TRSYYVTAVYDKGESMPSESVDVDLSTGVDNIAAGTGTISVSVSGNSITVTGAEGLSVIIADAAGRTVFATARADESLSVDVAPGVYIVKAGDKAIKVAL